MHLFATHSPRNTETNRGSPNPHHQKSYLPCSDQFHIIKFSRRPITVDEPLFSDPSSSPVSVGATGGTLGGRRRRQKPRHYTWRTSPFPVHESGKRFRVTFQVGRVSGTPRFVQEAPKVYGLFLHPLETEHPNIRCEDPLTKLRRTPEPQPPRAECALDAIVEGGGGAPCVSVHLVQKRVSLERVHEDSELNDKVSRANFMGPLCQPSNGCQGCGRFQLMN